MTQEKTKWKLSAEKIEQIFILYYENGWSKNDIAKEMDVDHSTIHYHIKRHQNNSDLMGILNIERRIINRTKRVIPDLVDDFDFDGSKINRGMTYQDYLDQDRLRTLARQAECRHGKLYTTTFKCSECGKMHTEQVNNHPMPCDKVITCQ